MSQTSAKATVGGAAHATAEVLWEAWAPGRIRPRPELFHPALAPTFIHILLSLCPNPRRPHPLIGSQRGWRCGEKLPA